MTSSLPFPLDIPQIGGFLKQVASQPYPPTPASLPLSESLYHATLHPLTPFLFAAVYIVCAKLANAQLRSNGGKSADLTKRSRLVWHAVLWHNIALAVYSAWTSVRSISFLVSYFYSGLAQGGFQGVRQAMCTVPTWEPAHDLSFITALFYYSKFYEVVDSAILACKGRKISSLQSYHHAGAMITMWLGVRFSAPPIWIFVSWNSTIHAMMYTFYACSILRISIPRFFKQALTTAQIFQLSVGGSIAASYFFVRFSPEAYQDAAVPFSSAVAFVQTAMSSSSSSFLNSTRSIIGDGPGSQSVRTSISDALARSLDAHGTTRCITTSGAALAVGGNVAYLLPLIVLFVRFYVASYLKKAKSD